MSDANKPLGERWSALWHNFWSTPRVMPLAAAIPDGHAKGQEYLPTPLIADTHYFQVEINQMFMAAQSKLWVSVNPTVFITTEFRYNGAKVTVPFAVGPSMIDALKQPVPTGMIFKNTKVAGLHPYKGGDMTLSVILCQMSQKDELKKILKLVETASGAIDYSTALSSYLKIANVVVDGVEGLMGLQGLNPLMGLRTEFHPEVDKDLKQRYFVLISAGKDTPRADELWVIDDELFRGKSFENSTPYRDSDFVLYSIRGTEKRDAENAGLPFDELWKRVQEESIQPDDNSWTRANSDMLSLFQTMYLSPDLTKKQALILRNDRVNEMKALHQPYLPSLTATLSDSKKVVDRIQEKKKELAKTEQAKTIATDENLRESTKILSP